MKLCSESISMSRLNVKAQLVWHRVLERVDAWGVMVAEPHMVYALCVAATCADEITVSDVAEALESFEALGMIWRYEVDGANYLATRKHEEYSWRSQRPVPELPMTQEVVDSREFWKALSDKRRARQSEERLATWARRCGVTITTSKPDATDTPHSGSESPAQRGVLPAVRAHNAASTPRTQCSVVKSSVVGCSSSEQPTRPADYQQRLQDARMGSAATNALHWDAEAVESIGGQDVLLYATALDIAANHETKWRAKQWAEVRREGILPGSEFVAQARAAFGLSKPPRLKRGVKRYRCECGHEYEAGPRDLECPECRSLEREEVALSA